MFSDYPETTVDMGPVYTSNFILEVIPHQQHFDMATWLLETDQHHFLAFLIHGTFCYKFSRFDYDKIYLL